MGEPLINDKGRWANESLYLEFAYTAIEVPKYKEQCCSLWFEDKAIKSAVEWLKKILKQDLEIQLKAGRKGQAVKLDFALHLIDEAFPASEVKNENRI